MDFTALRLISLVVLLLSALPGGWLQQAQAAPPQPAIARPSIEGSGVLLNEVMFAPAEGSHEWVELENTGAAPARLAGSGLTNEAGDWYWFPAGLPDVPPGGLVVVVFDGAGSGRDDLDFGDNVATLHSEPGMTAVLNHVAGSVALVYQPTSGAAPNAIYLPLLASPAPGVSAATRRVAPGPGPGNAYVGSFVAWGSDPGSAAAAAVSAGVWPEGQYVDYRPIGDGTVQPPVPGRSIGVVPGGLAALPDDWAHYQASEVSQGRENSVPGLPPLDAALDVAIDGATFSISWPDVTGATGYHFQMSAGAAFSPAQYDLILDAPAFVPGSPVPDGRYYWRVAALRNGQASPWSDPAEVTSITLSQLLNETHLASPNQPSATIRAKYLGIAWQLQRKDTRMVCAAGDNEAADVGNDRTRNAPWDQPHPSTGPVKAHARNYCERASVSMLASFYGGSLSQDRIAFEDYRGARDDLGHGQANVNIGATMNWAHIPYERVASKPGFDLVRTWLDSERPFLSLIYPNTDNGHFRVVDGYIEFLTPEGDPIYQFVHVLDPLSNGRWESWSATAGFSYAYVGPSAPGGAPGVLSDEDVDQNGVADTMQDSDGDGLVDFDERERFHTDPLLADSDGDGVPDKADLREYVFDAAGVYSRRAADWDGDGLSKELDADNDNDGSPDGCEDANHNGKLDPGETSNFNASQQSECKLSVTGKWSWVQSGGPWSGYFYITQTGDTFSGTLDDVWEGTYGDRVVDGTIDGTSFAFTRDGQYGIQYWQGTISVQDGVMEIKDGQWRKSSWSTGDWQPFTARYVGPG